MAQLLDSEQEAVQADPLAARAGGGSGCTAVVVMKGAQTHIVGPAGRGLAVERGNVGLATSGSGDTLAGISRACSRAARRPLRPRSGGCTCMARRARDWSGTGGRRLPRARALRRGAGHHGGVCLPHRIEITMLPPGGLQCSTRRCRCLESRPFSPRRARLACRRSARAGHLRWDVHGNRYLDVSSGPVVTNLGHGASAHAAGDGRAGGRLPFAFPMQFESEAKIGSPIAWPSSPAPGSSAPSSPPAAPRRSRPR